MVLHFMGLAMMLRWHYRDVDSGCHLLKEENS
jgi:hypothetical protein